MADAANRWRPSPIGLVSGAVLAGVIVALAISGGSGPLTAPKAILLGAVEGVTEFLPVSSTGHLLITERLLDLGSGKGKAAADTFAIAIQIGAIFAVVALYWQRIVQLFAGLVGRDRDGRTLLVRLCVAFVPAALVGVVFGDAIKSHLFGAWPVIAAWAVGGVFLLWWKPKHGTLAITDITTRSALIIGCAQILALWPGVSRSLVTLVAALGVGCAIGAALEFSFLLGLATLTAATFLDLAKDGGTLVDEFGWQTPLLGILVAFVTAAIAVKWLVGFLRTRPLAVFGWYRIGIALGATILLATNVI